jgi:hypothetical protein
MFDRPILEVIMRDHAWLALVALALPWQVGFARAGETEDTKALVDQVIAAHGGAARLAKLRAAVWKTEGVRPGRTTRATLYGQLPGKFRLESERTANGRTILFVKIINGDRGWTLEEGKAVPMSRAELAQVRDTFYHKQMDATLLPLRDKEVTLQLLGESKVDGHTVVGLKVSRKEFPEVRMYFDQKTKLLVKSERQVRGQASSKTARFEQHYSDYREHNGVKLAHRTRRFVEGKDAGDVRITSFEVRSDLGPALFLPPESGNNSRP